MFPGISRKQHLVEKGKPNKGTMFQHHISTCRKSRYVIRRPWWYPKIIWGASLDGASYVFSIPLQNTSFTSLEKVHTHPTQERVGFHQNKNNSPPRKESSNSGLGHVLHPSKGDKQNQNKITSGNNPTVHLREGPGPNSSSVNPEDSFNVKMN